VFLVFFAIAGSKLQLDQLAGIAIPVMIIFAVRAAGVYGAARLGSVGSTEPVIKRYVWLGLLPQSGLSLALVAVLQTTFSTETYGAGNPGSFGAAAGTLLLGVMTANLLLAPPLLRLALIRSGEAGKKQAVDFAAGGH
jgi:hypothetical protein